MLRAMRSRVAVISIPASTSSRSVCFASIVDNLSVTSRWWIERNPMRVPFLTDTAAFVLETATTASIVIDVSR
jgi:hypothetical protein